MSRLLYTIHFTPPPGLTDVRQLPHKWQVATEERVKAAAVDNAERALSNIKAALEFNYPQGWGTVARNLKYKTTSSRRGMSIAFSSAGRELQWMTRLGGGLFEPGATFFEAPNEGEFLSFFWKRFSRWARLPYVNHPGWSEDVLADEFAAEGAEFQQQMGFEYQRGASQLLESFGTPKPVGRKTRRNF